MDFLKIRKKAQEQRQAGEDASAEELAEKLMAKASGEGEPVRETGSHAASTAPPSAAARQPTNPPAAVATTEPPTSQPEEETPLPPTVEEQRAVFAQSRRHLQEQDPLGEFLAYYEEPPDEADLGPEQEDADAGARRYLTFDLADEVYAVTILDVKEILKTYAVTSVPRAPSAVLGVLSKRGVVMPVVDLAACLGLRPPEARMNSEQRILVVGDHDEVCGLRVDRVHAVVTLPGAAIESVPGGVGARVGGLLTGLGHDEDQMYILFDVPGFLAFLKGYITGDDALRMPALRGTEDAGA